MSTAGYNADSFKKMSHFNSQKNPRCWQNGNSNLYSMNRMLHYKLNENMYLNKIITYGLLYQSSTTDSCCGSIKYINCSIQPVTLVGGIWHSLWADDTSNCEQSDIMTGAAVSYHCYCCCHNTTRPWIHAVDCNTPQNKKAVTAYLKSKELSPFGFRRQYNCVKRDNELV